MITPLKRLGAYTLTSGTLIMSMASSVFANNNAPSGSPFGDDGVDSLPGAADGDGIKDIIVSVIEAVLGFLALLAVIVVVIAGIRLILSQGEDEQKDKAKKAIFYALIGLVIVLFARVIVGLVTNWLAGEVVTPE